MMVLFFYNTFYSVIVKVKPIRKNIKYEMIFMYQICL
jgi:hypothetical protein